jgi:FkbM family methyltransferase
MWLQLRFYTGYMLRKFALNFFEVRTPRFRLARLQFFYVLSKLSPRVKWQRFADFAFLDSIFGRFHLRPHTFDAICASPDFERPDIDRMISLIRATVASGKSVLFLDIGANIGVYSISVGNMFRAVEAVSICGFEPYVESHALFLENIRENNLTAKVTAFRHALSDREGDLRLQLNALDPGSNTVRGDCRTRADGSVVVPAHTLDHVIPGMTSEFVKTVLVMKIDVEGAEVSVLEGAAATLGLFEEVFVMVEDFVDVGICDYLESHGFVLMDRLTPYNSFWTNAGCPGVRVDADGNGGRSEAML